jgi:hypothetical protein
VRLALGTTIRGCASRIVRHIPSVLAGAVPGTLASIYAGRWLSSVVNANQSVVLGGVVAMYAAAALVAAAGPAWRASHLDPVVTLRV